MKQTEFGNMAELEEIQNGLARASRHPIHVDLAESYSEMGTSNLSQMELGDEREDVVRRLDDVELQSDIHVVWNNRDDERAYIGSQRYNLIQHREVIDAIREAVGRTTGSIEKGIVRDYGSHVSGTLVFGDQDDAIIDVYDLVGDGYVPPEGASWTQDRLGLGMKFHNSFDGRSGYGGTSMGYRFICGNWMIWGRQDIAERTSYHIKSEDETPGVDADYFEEVIGSVFEQRDALCGTVKRSIEDGELPIEWAPGMLEEAGFGKNYQKRIVSKLLQWEDGDYTDVWTLYNAATYHLDNERVDDLGPERYEHHHGSAWQLLEIDVEDHGDEVDDVRQFAAGVAQ
mgnify:CR=1 FL=1